MRARSLLIAATVAALVWGHSATGRETSMTAAWAAQAYRAGGRAVVAAPDGNMYCEAEEFRIETPGWQAKAWGENYYAATFANTFLSRKAFLGAPPDCEQSVATINVNVPQAGRYLALVRYEAAYRFETQFTLRIEQNGRAVLDRLYGARDNVKIWAFRKKLKKEVAWYWGAVENVVWEGHDAWVELQAGRAKISLIAGRQTGGPKAKRNVDLVMLTTDEAEVKRRIETENYLPLDGLLTQAGDVWMRVRSKGAALSVTAPPCTQHSPYWVHLRSWQAVTINAEAGQTTDWVDVGGVLDTMNDGQWTLKAAPRETGGALHYVAEFGLRNAAGRIEPIAEFESRAGQINLAYSGDTRYSRAVRDSEHVLYDLLDYLKAEPVRGKRPTRTLIFGYTFEPRPGNAKYTAALAEFRAMFGLSDSGGRGGASYIDVRQKSPAGLKKICEDLGEQAEAVRCVSLGDEIGLPRPGSAQAEEGLRNWLRGRGVRPDDVIPGAGDDWAKVVYNPDGKIAAQQPGLYYWSRRYVNEYGILAQKSLTDTLRAYLPNAGIGANFSPHHGGARHGYLGEVHKWVTLFRKEGMTMPWSEDYIWQLPMGSPQMNFINLDLSRAGLRHRPDAKIHYYVMPHWPGNTPRMWRRQFYGDVGHGMKIVNLFEFRPVQAAYTENHVSLPEMYLTVRTAFREMGLFEDIMQDGHVRPGSAALWFSETADIWYDNNGSFAAGKRALYSAIRHNQIPLDFVVEEDALDGTLKQYRVLYLTDCHVTQAASKAIAAWVQAGGRLFATAGAGMFDELNRPNTVLRELMGIEQTALDQPEGAQVGFIKQDLPFAEPIAEAGWKNKGVPVIGVRSRVELKGARAQATFADGLPAVTENKHGAGTAFYCAFLPGLSYFKPAIPLRPVDRGSTDDAMAHFIPTGFDPNASSLIAMPAADLPRPISCSEPLVEATIIEAKSGVLVALVNWSGAPVEKLKVYLAAGRIGTIELAGGGPLIVESDKAGVYQCTLDLDVADALVVR